MEDEEEEAGPCGAGPEEPDWEQGLSPELRQGLRILRDFLVEKHRSLASAFLREQDGEPGLLAMEQGFQQGRYRDLGDFVAEFRLMLEGCYRRRGVEHWMSKQGQRLEGMLEQKLALLSRPLREKTAIVVTSKGRYGLEDEKAMACTSTRRRSTPRSLAGSTTGAFESVMVQALRQEEQLKAKNEKRIREQGKKEAEEASYKEIEEWEKSLLAQTAPTCMENMWEIPAIGHFLCLAQQILNLPEIVFYELERCLLIPQSNLFLSKIMTSLLSPPSRRPSLHRRPPLPYKSWEAALRQKVQEWYSVVGQAENTASCAEKLGLGSQFFRALGDICPLEDKPFHELTFYQKVWLVKGLCDFVYETQIEVQDAVLGQPIHECREVILGYDSQENAYIHFPQFCGADVRIYKQIPFHAPEFPIPPIKIRRLSCIKLEKVKCEPANSNGNVSFVMHDVLLNPKTESDTELPVLHDNPTKSNTDCCSGCTKHQMKSSCEIKSHRFCDLKDSCCKRNTIEPICVRDASGYIDRFSPGEIRVLENGDKYVERPIGKTDSSPRKENSFKVCSVHMNGNHSEKTGINFHRKTKEETLERSLLNCKKVKLTKLHGKKKKKKKKKHVLGENLHGKYAGPQSQSFKSYKADIHSKLFFKKKTKHKKHKSGKKSISKRAITKKLKTVSRLPSIPEFQLVCTNLDELRQLITRIDVELKEFGNNRKKSGKSFVRKQTVRDLHSTLKRLLKELLPWEPKLMKAFHRNRARLKKDYDDFRKQPDHDKFIREVWTNEETDMAFGKEYPVIETKAPLEILENLETLKKGDQSDLNLSETELFGKNRSPHAEVNLKEMQITQPKTCKRHCKQNCCDDECTDDVLPSKKIKLSACEATRLCTEGNKQTGCCINELKQTEAATKETTALTESESSSSGGLKLATPVQALLAKNNGDKVTLSNQLLSNASRTINVLEKSVCSSSETSNTKSTLLCQGNTKNPLQVVYKMPGGQCVPLNLQNSSVKIQMQPVLDPKTGEKLMQQVLILPKNIFLQHKECKSSGKESVSLQQTSTEQVFTTSPQTTNATFSVTAPIFGTTYSQPFSSMPGKNIAQLTKLNHPIRSPPLSATVVPSPTKECLSDIYKLTTTTFPLTTALTTVTSFQPPVSVAALREDSNSCIPSPHETLQNIGDSSEMKQELKTVCIRDSQSILVRTRGGNTGVVKVQANSDNCSTSSLPTSSVFTFTPPGQAFLVSRATTSAQPSSILSSVTSSTVSTILPFAQPTVSRFSSSTTIPSCLNQLRGNQVKLTVNQPDDGAIGHLSGTTLQPPTYLSSCSLANSWLPASSSNSDGLINTGVMSLNTMDSAKMLQPHMPAIAQAASAPSEMGHATDKLPVIHNSATPANGDLISGAQVQKLLLVTSPVIPSGDSMTVGTVPRPTAATPAPQKLLLINTNLSNVSSASCFAAETSKQMLPSALGKAVLNTPESPHLLLIPSTVGASIKLCPSSTVSQIKEVKIGLNIGQTIINTSGTAQNTPPVNLLQSTSHRETEDQIRKGFVLPMTTNNLFPLCPLSQYTVAGNKSRDVGAKGSNSFSGTVNVCRGSISATTNNSLATSSSGLSNDTNDSKCIGTPSVGSPLSASVGNTVAISTVKTSHLASSVLLSTTQSTLPPPSIPTTLFPGVVSFPAPMTNTQKVKNLVSTAVPFMPIPKVLPQTILRYPSSGNTASLIHSTNVQKPQALFPSPLTNTKTLIANVASLPHDKTTTALPCNSAPDVSSVVQPPLATAPLANPAGQFGETCIQQKIVLNTNTPLAPGTQIMINGNRFIVPPHGLAAGSHVLLISTNTKQSPPLVLNNAQCVQIPVGNQAILKTPHCNLNLQPSKHPLNNSTNIVNSLGSAVAPPIVHASPHVNILGKGYAASPATANFLASIPRPQTAFVAKTSLVSPSDGGNPIFPSSTSALHLDKNVKKLLLSPEGAILNSLNSSVSKLTPLFPVNCNILESARKTSPTVLPTPQTSGSANLNIDAS